MRKPGLAVVHLSDCNGCGRCNADCPFTAITMKARTDGLPYELEAVVDPGLCMSCGICAGACPTATPFRSASALVPGIELEDQPVAALREATIDAAARLTGPARVIVFSCAFGADAEALTGPSVACVRVPCVAALPPSFVDFVISRRHADGVVLAGCREGDCHYRLGQHWTDARIAGTRDPHLRARVPRERICVHWAGPGAVKARRVAIEAFRGRLATMGPYQRAAARSREVPDA
jgi:ferredoxin/coenzyme F420-reducing hydrogenase delta subunit